MKKNIIRKLPLWVKILAVIFLGILLIYFTLKLWPNRKLKAFEEKQNSTRFYDRKGELIYIMPLENGLRREYVPLNKIPEDLIKSFLNEEDKNFYHHPGVDFLSVIRAYSQNKQSGHVVSGASTITMQLVRIITPRTKQVTVSTKIKEMFQAFYLEIKYSKNQILEMYLNNVPFGFQIEGVASAARSFYGCELFQLTQQQQNNLALIPRRPSDYAPQKNYTYPNPCPHFINYVINSYKNKNEKIPNELTLSIDSELNILTEKQIQIKLDEYSDSRIHNGAAFVMNNHTGEIMVWLGNASFEDSEHGGQIDGVLVPNQPGSSMKPFLYALGFEDEFTPNSVLPDIPLDFGHEKVYVPLNFNNRYNGPVRYRVALASSLNIPAVYVLYNEGIDSYISRLQLLGFDTLAENRNSIGLSLALGSQEVTLYEMVRAFSNFTNDGKRINTVFEKNAVQHEAPVKCYEPDTARVMCSILSDKNARSLGFGHAQVFDTPYNAIFKTGTSNQFQNIIALGSTSDFTAGVWMGNFEGETVVSQTGSSIPATIVRSLLDELCKDYGYPADFQQPQHYRKEKICTLSGMKCGPACPSSTSEYIPENIMEMFNAKPCDWHYRKGGKVEIKYPSQYQHWGKVKNYAGSYASNEPLDILYPRNKASFIYDPTVPQYAQEMAVEAYGGFNSAATLYIDGQFFGTAENLFLWHVPLTPGHHTLTVECGNESVTQVYDVN